MKIIVNRSYYSFSLLALSLKQSIKSYFIIALWKIIRKGSSKYIACNFLSQNHLRSTTDVLLETPVCRSRVATIEPSLVPVEVGPGSPSCL